MTARKFERQTCTRCGGSGRYSYNQITGDRCFGCEGSGQQLTKRGSAAHRWFKEQRKIRLADVKVGDYIGTGGGNKFVVHSIKPSVTTGKSMQPDGTWKDSPPFFDVLPRPGSIASGLVATADAMVETIPSSNEGRRAELERAFDYQDTLTKTGTSRKRS